MFVRAFSTLVIGIQIVACATYQQESVASEVNQSRIQADSVNRKENGIANSSANDFRGDDRPAPPQLAVRGESCDDYVYDRVRESDSNLIRILQSDVVVAAIKLPTGQDINGFSVNFVREIDEGFLFSVEYGSRYYFEKTFFFECRNGKFFLFRMKVRTHDQADPERTSKEQIVKVDPAVPLENFDIWDYIPEIK